MSGCAQPGLLDARLAGGCRFAGRQCEQLGGQGLNLALDGGRVQAGVGVDHDRRVYGGDGLVSVGPLVWGGREVVFSW